MIRFPGVRLLTERELHAGIESRQPSELHARREERLRLSAQEQRVAELQREVAQLRGRETTWRAERARLLAALEEAEQEVAELPAIRHEADVTRDTAYWLAVVQASWSWRLTRPLRAVSRLGGRLRRRSRSS